MAEDSGENLVHIFQLAGKIEGVFDLLARDSAGDLFVGEDQLVEVEILLPGPHGVRLDQAVGVFAAHTVFDEIEEQLSTEDQAARAFEVSAHAFGVDEHGVDQVGGPG